MARFLVCQCRQFECLGGQLRLRRILGGSRVRTFTPPRGGFLVIIAVIVIIAVGIFVHRREAQLIAEAERAMPGPLKLRQ